MDGEEMFGFVPASLVSATAISFQWRYMFQSDGTSQWLMRLTLKCSDRRIERSVCREVT